MTQVSPTGRTLGAQLTPTTRELAVYSIRVALEGICVNAVCPGPVHARMIHSLEAQLNPAEPASVGRRYQSTIPIGRYITPDEIANTVLFPCSTSPLRSPAHNTSSTAPHRHRRRRDPGDAELSRVDNWPLRRADSVLPDSDGQGLALAETRNAERICG
jgi:hypothetical protein